MYDSHKDPDTGEYTRSDAVSYDIREEGDGKLTLTVTADPNWLNSPDRVYPIYIDPSTNIYASEDAFNCSSSRYADTNFGADKSTGYYQLRCGYWNSWYANSYSYIKFNTSSFNGAYIDSASLNLHCRESHEQAGVWIDRLTSNWSEFGVTWDNRPSQTGYTSGNATQGYWSSFNITSAMRNWTTGAWASYGLAIIEPWDNPQYFKRFSARENTDGTAPYIRVYYDWPSIYSVGINKGNNSTYTADDTEILTATYKVKTSYLSRVDSARLLVNYQDQNNNPNRGYIIWSKSDPGSSYVKASYSGGGYFAYHTDPVYGSDKITPLLTSCSFSDDTTNGIRTFTFKWKLKKDYGDVQYNDLSAHFYIKDDDGTYYAKGWTNYDTNFKVLPASTTFSGSTYGLDWTGEEYPNNNDNRKGRGYINLSWGSSGATANGYKVYLFDGYTYRLVETLTGSSSTSWSSLDKPIFPPDSVIDAELDETTNNLFNRSDGLNLRDNPNALYKKTSGTTYDSETGYLLKVSAYNSIGETQHTLQMTLPTRTDTEPPASFNLSSPTEDSWVDTQEPVLSWNSTSDSLSGLEKYYLKIDGEYIGTFDPLTTSFQTLNTLSDGPHSYQVIAVDSVGNKRSTVPVVFNIDAIDPMAHISYPANDATISGTVDVKGTADDRNLADYTLEYGSGANPTTWKTIRKLATIKSDATLGSFDTTALENGDYTVRLSVKDKSGKVATSQILVHVHNDTIAPSTEASTTPSAPDGHNGWFNSAASISLTISETGTAYYKWNSSSAYNKYTGPIAAPEGENTLYYYSVDSAGNTEPVKSKAIKVDTKAPSSFNLISPSNGSTAGLKRPTLSWQPSSDKGGSGLVKYQLYIDDVLDTDDITPTVTSIRPSKDLSGGLHSWYVKAIDSAGNTYQSPTLQLNVDISALFTDLSVYLPSPDFTSGWYKTTPIITLKANSASTTYYKWSGDSNFVTYEGSIVAPTGDKTLYYYSAEDSGTQESTKSVEFKVDPYIPEVSFTAPSTESTVSGEVPITASGSDDVAFDKMKLSIKKYGTNEIQDIGTLVGSNVSWMLDTTRLADGEYVLTITGYDVAGNINTASMNVKVENTPYGMGLDRWGTVDNRHGKVNIVNGNFVIEQNDISLPGLGLATELGRVYNSQAKANGIFGPGWRMAVPELAQYSDGTVVITDPDGTEHRYTRNQDGSYKRPTGNYINLTKNADSSFTWRFKDGKKYIFDITDKNNKKTTLKDRYGNAVVYWYDSDNPDRIFKVTGSSGRQIELTYDPTGKLVMATDKLTTKPNYASRTWTYTYNNGSLVKVAFQGAQEPQRVLESYAYDGQKIISITDAAGNTANFSYAGEKLASVTEYPDINTAYTTSYGYNEANKAFVETNALGHSTTYVSDGNWNVQSIIDALENTTTVEYDEQFNLTRRLYSVGGQQRAYSYTYDGMGNVLSAKDPAGNTTTYTYTDDGYNNISSKTDALGAVTSYIYNDKGNVTEATDALGRKTTYTYDSHGNKTGETNARGFTATYAYDHFGNLIKDTDALGNEATYRYDDYGSRVAETDRLSHETLYVYDDFGNRVAEVNALGRSTTFVYDAVGNLTSQTDALGQTTTFAYDGLGNKKSETNAMGKTTSYAYDAMGRKISETNALNETVRYSYDAVGNLIGQTDALNNTTKYAYDSVGNRISQTDANNNITRYTYDAVGNLISIVDALDNTSTIEYDAVGNKVSETDASGNKTTYAYDSLGNMLSVMVPGGGVTQYGYDEVGNKVTSTDTAGNVATWEYDALNRAVKAIEPDKIKTYSYDANGSVITEVDSSSNTTSKNVIDELRRLQKTIISNGETTTTTQYIYDAVGNKTYVIDSSGATKYEYDPCNNLTKEINPEDKKISYFYNDVFRLTETKVDQVPEPGQVSATTISTGTRFIYDSNDNLTSMVDPDNRTTTFSYDANSNRVNTTYPNNAKIDLSYDAINRPSGINNIKPDGQVFASFSYAYNENNRITEETTQAGKTTYKYDEQNRLTEIVDPAGKLTKYTYDSVGNRVSMVETVNGVDYTTTYLYNTTNNHLEKVTKPDNSTITFLYSPNGNTIAKASIEGTVTYEYNPENQLTKVTKPNGDTVEFTYDGQNRRISKTTNGAVTKYVYDGDLISLETDANGKRTATYEYDDFGAPVSVIKGGSIYFYHYNGQGDVIALTDANGSIAATYKYDPWGNIVEKTGSVDTPFTYRGKYGYVYDKETSLYFLKSRYYDPEIGRFTTKDRFEGFEDAPASQHPYLYCENDPVNAVDPTGLVTEILVHTWQGIRKPAGYVGHSAIRLSDTVYSFGRYGASKYDTVAPGILLKMPYNSYKRYEQDHFNRKTYAYKLSLTKKQEIRVRNHIEGLIGKGKQEKWTLDSRKYPGKRYRLRSNYHLYNNNCTTFILDALKQGLSKKQKHEYRNLLRVHSPAGLDFELDQLNKARKWGGNSIVASRRSW